MSPCDIYVINIPGSDERREHIAAQLKPLNVSYQFFSAVDGKNGSHPLFEKYNETTRLRLKGKSLLGGQLGCYASHYLLWEKCVSDNKPMIVLEDDARIFPEHFLQFYHQVDALHKRYECIRLFENLTKHTRHSIKVDTLGDFGIYKYTKGYMGTIGYYLTPPGAKKFIQDSKEWFLTVDIFMDRFWSNKVEYYGLLPPCLDFEPELASEIDYIDQKADYPLADKLRRELFTTGEAFRRLLWNTQFRIKHRFKDRAAR